jgi:bifunctional non-homologous end joining protein LigD
MARRNHGAGSDSLASYNAKRDFTRTAEPPGRVSHSPRGAASGFVVQKHAARKLHYDFRLELDGVLKSWAVTRGPSLDPQEKRLAVRTEDHPLDYQYFEGSIPEGEYGGGSMLIWDRGAWVPRSDPHRGLERGLLKFDLEGERLRGGFALVRMKGGRAKSDKESWLLVKENDAEANPAFDPLAEWTDSIATRRSMEEVAANPPPAAPSSATGEKRTRRTSSDKKQTGTDGSKRGKEKEDDVTRDEVILEGVRLSSPDKVLYPIQGTSKREVAEYLLSVQQALLAHIARRPLTLVRCPRGRSKKCFFQKHHSDGLPDALKPIEITENTGKPASYVYVEDAAGLVGTAQVGVLELHVWASTIGHLEQPDRLIFDLDPDESIPFSSVKRAAVQLRDRLAEEGLESFALLTGGKGIHVVIPLQPRLGWQELKGFARGFAQTLAEQYPDDYVATASKAKRKGKIYIDWLRNDRGATAIAPYASRAREHCPIATPVRWRELSRVQAANQYTIANIHRRLSRLKADPWEGYFTLRQTLSDALVKKYT